MFSSLKKLTILWVIKCTESQHIRIDTYILSHIITQHKNSQLNSLVHRESFTISDKVHLQTELNHLKQAFKRTDMIKKV